MTRPPPPRLVHAATAIRTTLQSMTRRMVPPQIGLLRSRWEADGDITIDFRDAAGLRLFHGRQSHRTAIGRCLPR